MKKELIKYTCIILLIIIGCVVLSRTLTSSETVEDYALKEEKTNMSETTPHSSGAINSSSGTIMTVVSPTLPPKDVSTDEIEEDLTELDNEEDFYIEPISDELKEIMIGKSYADDIDESKISFKELRHVVIRYNDFNGNTTRGELVCNELIAEDLLDIFKKLYEAGYELEEVSLIDKYDADDDKSMEANNTSCFNYRLVDRTTKLSYHAYGLAIDINPLYNPYVEYKSDGNDYICPTQSVPYAYRDTEFPYKIDENDLAYKLFKEHGFTWGGDWNSCKDYQHFEKRLIQR